MMGTTEVPHARTLAGCRRDIAMNDMGRFASVFDDVKPWSGTPPTGFYADWLGAMTDAKFRAYLGIDRSTIGGTYVQTRRPEVTDGEAWFEAVNQVEAARDARGRFVMVTLGACYGAQAVGCYLALDQINRLPFKLVAVEPEPVNLEWVAQHFRDNGIDPAEQWLIGSAISDTNKPVFFPVGAPGSGAQNCYSTNEMGARQYYVETLINNGRSAEALRNLLLHNTTGLTKQLLPGAAFEAEITVMSAVTLSDVLSPFEKVDFLESDIQQSEIVVFPPFMELVTRKVRRVHIGTHGADVHDTLARLFRAHGWDIVFDFAPNSSFDTSLGSFTTNDGVLSAINPQLA